MYTWEHTILHGDYVHMLDASPRTLSTEKIIGYYRDTQTIGYVSAPPFSLIHMYGDPYAPTERTRQRQCILRVCNADMGLLLMGDLNSAHTPADRYYPEEPHFRPGKLKDADVHGWNESCAQLQMTQVGGDGGYDLVHEYPTTFARSSRGYTNMALHEVEEGSWAYRVLTEERHDALSDHAPMVVALAPIKQEDQNGRLYYLPANIFEMTDFECLVREIMNGFLKKEVGVPLLVPWAAARVHSTEGPCYGKALPTPEWWISLPDEQGPISPALLEMPEILLDAFRYAVCTVAIIMGSRAPQEATTNAGRRRVLLTVTEIASVKRKRRGLDDPL